MIFKQIPTAIKDMNKLGAAINFLGTLKIGNVAINDTNIQLYRNAIKGLSAEQAAFALSSKGVNEEQIREIMLTETAIGAKDAYSNADIQAALAKNRLTATSTVLTAKQQEEIVNSGLLTSQKMAEMASVLGLEAAEGGALVAKEALNAESVKEQLTSIGVTSSTQAQILSILGLTAAEGGAVVGTNLLTAAFQKLKKTIMSNPYLFIIGAVLAGCIGIYNAIKKHSEKAEERIKKIKEAAKEAKSEISNIKSDFENLSSSTNGIKEKFATLAQGVANLGKINQSRGKLSSEDYEEFLGLSNQLAELFPQLKVGFDDNGNSILGLSGNVDTIVDSLNNLVSVQKKLADQQIIEEIPNIWKGYIIDLSEYKSSIDKTQSLINELSSFNINGKVTIKDFDLYNTFLSKLEEIGINDPFYYNYTLSGKFIKDLGSDMYNFNGVEIDFSLLDKDKINILKDDIYSAQKNFENILNLTTQYKLPQAKAEMSDFINTWLSNEQMYLQIKNPAMKDLARDVLLNSDWIDNLPDDVKNKDWDKVSNWIQQHFLYAINNLDDEEIQTALANAVNGEFTIASLQETINGLLKIDGFDSNNPLIVYLQAKLNDRNLQISNTKSKLNTNLSEDELNSRLDKLSSEDLQIAAEQISIPDGALLSWDELITKINEYKSAINDTSLSSFSDLFNSVDFSETAQKLLDLAKSGEITPEVLESTEEYNELLKKTGDTAQEAADKILNLLSDQEKLAAASNVLDSIKSAYDEFNELGFVTASTLEDLPDVLKNLEVFDIFSQIAGDPTHGKEKIQQAFNDIITHYLISQDTLSGIIGASESSIQSYIANLKEMGITNAEEIVNSLRTIYKSDYDNWCDLLVKKAASYNDFSNMVNKISASGWASFMGYSGLTPELEKKMEEGALTFVDALRIAGNTSEAQKIMEQQAKYQQDFMQAEKKKTELGLELKTIYSPNESSTDSLDSSTQSFDWLQTKITRTEEALDHLSQKASNTYSSWTERNNALSQSIDRTKAAIELQRQAYSAYMKEADSVGLPEHYKSLVQSGAINASDIVDSNLADQINEYQELYEKALSCSDTVSELEQSLNELTFGTRWNNIKTELDAVVGVFDTDIELIQTKLDNLEIRGLFADSSYYSDMKDLTAKKLATLNSEAGQLKSILSSMSKDNEGYNNLFSELMDINKEIAELENNCIEFNTKMRGLDWEIFDYLEKAVNRITDETEYLIGLLEKEKLFDENGSFTKYGDAALGLHSAAYETYKRQADDYYAEIAKLQKQLADGAGQDVLEHYNELTDAHRAAVNAADSEKQSILELIEDGYNAQLDAIQKLIDKKKEQLDSEKDLYDYQKSIAEKSAKVSSLEKQKLAYADDDSEEAMSRIQQLNVQLEEAKTDLAEAEYDKYLKDTENMLDKLSEDYESWINKRLDDEDALLSEIINAVSDKGDQINDVLNEIASKNDTFISDSIRGIFDADQPFAAVMNGVKDAVTGVGTAVAELKNAVLGISGTYGTPKAADKNTSVAGGIQPDKNASSSKNSGSTSFAPSSGNSGRQNTPSGSGSWGSWFVKKNDTYPKNKLNKDSSIIDRLKFFGIDSSFASRAAYYKAMGGDGSYIGSASQNIWMLNQMKSHGYKSGTYGAASGPHWTQENGGEFILRKSDGAMLVPLGQGDMVFSNESSKRLYEFAQNPEAFMKKYNLSAPVMTAVIPYSALDYKLPNSAKAAQRNASASVSIGGINITCNEVQNARELMEDVTDHLIRNNRFEKAMSTMINNRMTGKNPLEHLKYVKH